MKSLQLRVPVLSVVLHHENLWSGSIRIAECDQDVVDVVWRTSIFKGFKKFVVLSGLNKWKGEFSG